jgi:chemotaxis protein CheY-P-specific phosphatase CheC
MEIKKVIIDTLEDAGSKIETELGGLLGCQLAFSSPETTLVNKAEFFSATRKKMVMTHMAISGDKEGSLYVFCQLKDAVKLGGILIMLPPAELEKRIKKEEFGEEEADAFGEIANILSGDLNSAFEDSYPEKFHFKKTDLQVVLPAKVDAESAEPFPPGDFVCASYPMRLEDQELGELALLFPAEVLGMAASQAAEEDAFVPSGFPLSAGTADEGSGIFPATRAKAVGEAAAAENTIVLIVAEGKGSAETLAEVLQESGWGARLLGGKENFKEVLQNTGAEVRGIFLVMENIEDQSFATAIKIRSAFGKTVPLIAAGSQWTRTNVLQAVKYGVRDILVLPATKEEILEKAAAHFTGS